MQPEKENEIHISLASDDRYVHHLAVTICSLLKNTPKRKEIHFYILDDKVV